MKYSVILADCPWEYKSHRKGQTGAAENHYPVMKLVDIANLPVEKIAARDSVLFHWATAPCFREALEVMAKWGFEYKTIAFTWIKLYPKKGIETLDDLEAAICAGQGHYTMSNAEFCLVGTKGKGLERLVKNVKSVIITRRGEHSEKPLEVIRNIDKLYGDVKRIELFARNQQPGWDAMGWDINQRDIRECLPELIYELECEDLL